MPTATRATAKSLTKNKMKLSEVTMNEAPLCFTYITILIRRA